MHQAQPRTAANEPSTHDTGLLLTRDELAELTGTRQAARQRRWLHDRRWPFIEALGRGAYPRVSRELARKYLKGFDHCPETNKGDLNLAALEAMFGGRRKA